MAAAVIPGRHLRDHPRCELCQAEQISSPSVTVGLVETARGGDTFTLRAVCRVHRTMLVAAYIAAGDDPGDDPGDPDDSGSGPGDADPDGSSPDLSPGPAIVDHASSS